MSPRPRNQTGSNYLRGYQKNKRNKPKTKTNINTWINRNVDSHNAQRILFKTGISNKELKQKQLMLWEDLPLQMKNSQKCRQIWAKSNILNRTVSRKKARKDQKLGFVVKILCASQTSSMIPRRYIWTNIGILTMF